MTAIIRALLGAALLLTGRKMYWLFVGVIGFVVGLSFGAQVLKSESELLILIIALTAGIVGAVAALFVQRLAVGLAGFIAGGYLLTELLKGINLGSAPPPWLVFLVGGIVGAVLVLLLFDWALIILSSLMGISLITTAFHFGQWVSIVLWVVLFILGVWIQASSMSSK